MTTRIAICVDDYGLHPAVDDAVLALVAKGRVTATSCMVAAPAWRHGAARLKEPFDAGGVDAGLHLDLTEHTIAPGMRQSLFAWMRDSVLRRVDRNAIRAEISAQLDAFEAAMGRAPSHVDGHRHVHEFPVVRDVLLDELERRYARPQRPWLRRTQGAGRWALKGHVIEAMGSRALARESAQRGFAQNATLLGAYDFRGGAERFRRLLRQWLSSAHEGDLLMCHVATGIVPGDEIAQARVDEYGVFASDWFDELLREHAVAPARMSAMKAG